MRDVTVDPAAIQDIAEASGYYNREREGLGKIFREYVKTAIKQIAKQPHLYVYIAKPYRGYFLDKFPFTVYYRETEDGIHILAVLHQRRHPGYWKDRLKDSSE
jgi:plasmid stabilization system protein ParE